MSQCVEIRCACAVAHPQPFLTCGFEAGIVTLTLRPQGVSPFKVETAAVNGKPVVIGNGLVFCAAPVFLPIVPVFVVTRANTGLGLTEGAAEFLPGTIIVGGFSVLVHSQSGRADRITGRKRFRGFRAAWIERDILLSIAQLPRAAFCYGRSADTEVSLALLITSIWENMRSGGRGSVVFTFFTKNLWRLCGIV